MDTAKLKKSNSDLEKFAYMVSHDLQAPIRRIASFCDVAKDELSNGEIEKASEYLNKIESICNNASEMIFNILNLSKVNNEHLTKNKVKVSELIRSSILPFLGKVERKEMELYVKADFEGILIANIQNIRDVFFNLISNAIKYQQSDKVLRVDVEVSLSQKKDKFIFKVKDNGIGIKNVTRVFGFLEREGLNQAGYGIGLATCKRIITAHQGEIWCESTVGEGASFFFSLSVDELF